MPSQVIVIGAPTDLPGHLEWSGQFGVVYPGLTRDGGTAYLRLVRFTPVTGLFLFRVSPTVSGGPNSGGPDLSDAWESHSSAITIRAGELSITMPGPNHPDNLALDVSEPYLWGPPLSDILSDFWNDYRALSDEVKAQTTITLDDGERSVIHWAIEATRAADGTGSLSASDFGAPVLAHIGRPGGKGQPGPKGLPGPAGDPGPAGPKGGPGAKGPRGQGGDSGDPGDPGGRGAKGPRGGGGAPGEKGPTGSIGRKGPRGQGGPAGPKGPRGASGGPGPTGQKGPSGERGPKGGQGATGRTGSPGSPGPLGPAGGSGSGGDPGEPGQGPDYDDGYAAGFQQGEDDANIGECF